MLKNGQIKAGETPLPGVIVFWVFFVAGGGGFLLLLYEGTVIQTLETSSEGMTCIQLQGSKKTPGNNFRNYFKM